MEDQILCWGLGLLNIRGKGLHDGQPDIVSLTKVILIITGWQLRLLSRS